MELSRSREKLVARLRSSRMREREGMVLVEGLRTCREALRSPAEVRFAVCTPGLEESTEGATLAAELKEAGVTVHRVDEEHLAGLSDTETPQGCLLVCAEPRPSGVDAPAEDTRLLVLDGVQDPGNVGTLIRAAWAFAVSGVVALDGTADPWGAKAVRASAGGCFHVPVLRTGWEGWRERPSGLRLLVADAAGDDVAGADASPPWALVVGNEARGARAEVREAAAALVALPMAGGAESLNAAMAGAILLYDLGRSR